jgi:serine/threonine protein kinase
LAIELREQLQTSLGSGYRVSRELGGGGMAHVFVADDPAFKHRVVVKVLSPDLTAGVDGQRFKREIRVASSLHHPRIVPVLKAANAGVVLYYTMPFIEGDSLRALLDGDGPLSIPRALSITRDVAEALEYAHSKNIVHRDVKPENVLIERATGRGLVTDFGIARAIERAADISTLTSTGLTLGTPTYMSPEQAAGELDIDGRSDVYSLGCVLHELVTGTPPFVGKNMRAIIAQHMTEPAPRLRIARPDAPEHVQRLLDRMLAKAPHDRLSATNVLAVLDGRSIPDSDAAPAGRWSPIRDATARLWRRFT